MPASRKVLSSCLFGLFLIAAALCSGEGDRTVGSETPWKDLEAELLEKGLKTDTASLLELAESSKDPGQRWLAIEILGLRGEQVAKDELAQLLHDEDRLVQEAAAVALVRLGDQRGTRALSETLDAAPSPEQKLRLARRLAEVGDPAGYPYVLQGVKSDDKHVRFLSVDALVPFMGLSGLAVDPVEEFLSLARDPEAQVRFEILVQMPFAVQKGVQVTRFDPVVKKMAAEDPDPEVREKAKLLLILWQAPESNRDR